MAEPNLISALIALLKADADVNTATGGRVWGGEVPSGQVDAMPQASVVVQAAGGLGVFGRGYQRHSDKRVDVICYADSPRAAYQLWLQVRPVLKHMRRQVQAGTVLHWARPSGDATQARDPDTDWPAVLSTWQVLAAEETVA